MGSERRKVESHLVVCSPCRANRTGLANALDALRAIATEPLISQNVGAESPSLWPALQRQIRETRHEPSTANSAIAEWLSRFDRPTFRPARMAAIGLIAATSTWMAAGTWSRSQIANSRALTEAASRPVFVSPVAPHSALDFGTNVAKTEAEPSARGSDRTPSRFGYDLDRGTVTNSSDAGQIKPSY